jgi:hypothetical protein
MTDPNPFIELLRARIDTVAPGIEIVPATTDPRISQETVEFSADGSELRVGMKSFGSVVIRKDMSRATYWLQQDLALSPKNLVSVYSFVSSILHAVAGHLTFHANGLTYEGRSYALLGESGSGKSSLTLAALKSGHRLVGDDTVALTRDCRVTGGRPFLHLTPGTVRALLPQQKQIEHKTFFLLSALGLEAALPEAGPLARIYLLKPGEEISITPCTDHSLALLTLLKSSGIVATLLKYDPTIVDRLLQQIAAIGVRMVAYPRRWECLPEVLTALEDDIARR